VFGVFTPSITIGYSAYAIPDMQILGSSNFTEYLNYTFYPNRTQSIIGTNLTLAGNVLYEQREKAALLTSTNDGISFGQIEPGIYYRTSYARNIYGEEATSAVRTMSVPAYVDDITTTDFLWVALCGIGLVMLYLAFNKSGDKHDGNP
jgi:hypothetical protein